MSESRFQFLRLTVARVLMTIGAGLDPTCSVPMSKVWQELKR